MEPIRNVIGQQPPDAKKDLALEVKVIEFEEEGVEGKHQVPNVEIILPVDKKALKLLKIDLVRNPLFDPNRKVSE